MALYTKDDDGAPMWNHLQDRWENVPFAEILRRFQASVDVRDRKYRLQTYPRCFVGSHAVSALTAGGVAVSRQDALRIGALLLDAGQIEHCLREHNFKDEFLFYRFIDDPERGLDYSRDKSLTWASYLKFEYLNQHEVAQVIDVHRLPSSVLHIGLSYWPMDTHNVRLLDNVHPPRWVDPRNDRPYHLVIVGAGPAGLEAAISGASCGARVALIESNILGGNNVTGCIPTKTFLRKSNLVYELRNRGRFDIFGVKYGNDVNLDFPKLMEKVRESRSIVASRKSSVWSLRKMGVDMFFGHAKFLSEQNIIVGGHSLEFKRALITTGSYCSLPPIPGLRELFGKQDPIRNLQEFGMNAPSMVVTSDNLFNMTSLPRRICVLGVGVIAMEIAQAFVRLGSTVIMFGRADSLIPNGERDLVSKIVRQCEHDGIQFRFNVSNYQGVKLTGKVDLSGHREMIMQTFEPQGRISYKFDCIIVASRRKANVSGLNLDAAAVDYDTHAGIRVNDYLQTSNSRIFSAGDCCTLYRMVHAATAMGRLAVRNSLLLRRERLSDLILPLVCYTYPELARVGLTTWSLQEEGRPFEIVEYSFDNSPWAISEGLTYGVLRLFVQPSSGVLLGGVVLGKGAATIASLLAMALHSKLRLEGLTKILFPYSTVSESLRNTAVESVQWSERVQVKAKKFRSGRRQSVSLSGRSRSSFNWK